MNINPKSADLNFLANVAEESARLRGEPIELIQVSKESDFYNEGSIESSESLMLYALIDSNPSRSLLKSMNWYIEDQEVNPVLFNLPIVNQNKPVVVQKGNLVKYGSQVFEVRDVGKEISYGIWYILKCIPYDLNRIDVQVDHTDKHKNQFLKRR